MTEPSVVYRTGAITTRDYDEAIDALYQAKAQLIGLMPVTGGCGVCGDSGHLADTCHHNPLVIARKRARGRWVCFHCDLAFDDVDEAEQHFGNNEHAPAACEREVHT